MFFHGSIFFNYKNTMNFQFIITLTTNLMPVPYILFQNKYYFYGNNYL
jgi:hypothetical protein